MLITISIQAIGQEKSKLMKEGSEFFFNKQYPEALKCFQKELKTSPTIEVKFWIAHCYAEMKQISNAKPRFLEIINSNTTGPEIAMSLVNLGNCYRETKQIDSAHYYYDKAITDFPKYSSAYFNKGQLFYSTSQFKEAKINYDKAIAIDSSDWWYFQKRLEVSFASQDYEGALHDLKKVNQLNPPKKNQMNIAYCYTMLKRYKDADSIFQIIYNDKDAVFLNNYGLNKHNMGETNEGKEIILKSISLDPKNSYAYRNLATIAIAENNKDSICKYLSKARELGFEKNYGTEVNELLLKYCN